MAQNDAEAFGICYRPYVAMVAFFDDAHAFRIAPRFGGRVFDRIATAFTKECVSKREALERNFGDYRSACGSAQEGVELPSYLYKPAYAFTFGHTDMISIVLLDDFDPFLHLAGKHDPPMEQVNLAFCPTLESLGLSDGAPNRDPELPSALVELEDLLQPHPDAEKDDRGNFRFAFQECNPLVTVSRLKVGGLGILGNGLSIQRATFRAMARKIEEVRGKLRRKQESGDEQLTALDIHEEDIRDVLVVLLDGIGSEDILICIFSKNYSVALSIVTALRNLTFGELAAEDEPELELVRLSEYRRVHDGIVRVVRQAEEELRGDEAARREAGEKPEDARPANAESDSMGRNHLFAATYTCLGVNRRAFERPDKSVIHGVAEVYARVNVNPGHFKAVEDGTRLALDSFSDNPELQVAEIDQSWRQFHRFMVGRYDYDFSLAWGGKERYAPIPIKVFFRRTASMMELFTEVSKESGETGVMDVSSGMVIPFPRWEGEEGLLRGVAKGHRPLIPALAMIRDALFTPPRDKPRRAEDAEREPETLCVETLREAMQRLGVPSPLRGTIEYMYGNYAKCLADPLFFEGVLDLYDTFRELHWTVTEFLPGEQDRFREELPGPKGRRGALSDGFFDSDMVDALGDFVDALQNAATHRISVRPSMEMCDWAIDFRGGLNQLVAAADVPLKCGIGLWKYCRRSEFGRNRVHPSPSTPPKGHRVGAVTRLTFHLNVGCRHVRFLPEHPRPMVQLDVNVAHIFNPAKSVEYLHEAAHLILEALDSEKKTRQVHRASRSTPKLPAEHNKLARDAYARRRHEIFADLLTHLFVFGADYELFRRYQMISYNAYHVSIAREEEITLIRLAERLLRCFMVSGPIEDAAALSRDARAFPDAHPWLVDGDPPTLREGLLEPLCERFLGFAEEIGPFFSHFHRFWNVPLKREAAESLFRERFKQLCPDVASECAGLWKYAVQIYKGFARDAFPWNAEGGRDALSEAILASLESGQACVQAEFDRRYRENDNGNPREYALDPLTVVCQLLYAYIGTCYAAPELFDPERGIHLLRSPEGEVVYEPESPDGRRGWNPFQLDHSNPRHFCSDPERRSDRLRREIVVLKQLWDLSTLLRARRLTDIISYHWPP